MIYFQMNFNGNVVTFAHFHSPKCNSTSIVVVPLLRTLFQSLIHYNDDTIAHHHYYYDYFIQLVVHSMIQTRTVTIHYYVLLIFAEFIYLTVGPDTGQFTANVFRPVAFHHFHFQF